MTPVVPRVVGIKGSVPPFVPRVDGIGVVLRFVPEVVCFEGLVPRVVPRVVGIRVVLRVVPRVVGILVVLVDFGGFWHTKYSLTGTSIIGVDAITSFLRSPQWRI